MTSRAGDSEQVLERLPDRLIIQVLHFLSTSEQHRILHISRSMYLQLCCLPFVEILSFPPEDGSFELLLRPHRHIDLLLEQHSLLMEQQRHARDVKRRLGLGQDVAESVESKRARVESVSSRELPPTETAEEAVSGDPSSPSAERHVRTREQPSASQFPEVSEELSASTRQRESEAAATRPSPLELERLREAQLSGHRKSLLDRCPFLLRFSRVSQARFAIPTHLDPSAGFDEGSFQRRRRVEEAVRSEPPAEGEGISRQEGSTVARPAEFCSCASVLPEDWVSPNLWLSRPAFTALLEASCRSLEELRLELSLRRGYGVAPLTEGILEGFKLTKLRFLEIVNITRSNLKLGPCVLPALKTLHLHWLDASRSTNARELEQFLTSAPSLQRLAVHADTDDDEERVTTTLCLMHALRMIEERNTQQQPSEARTSAEVSGTVPRAVPLSTLREVQVPMLTPELVSSLSACCRTVEVLRLGQQESNWEARGRAALQMAARHLPLLRRIEVPVVIVPFQIPRDGGDSLHAPPPASTAAVAAAAAAAAIPTASSSVSAFTSSVNDVPHVWTPDAPVPVVRGRVSDFFIPH